MVTRRTRRSYARFHEKEPTTYRKVKVPDMPRELWALGEAVEVVYKRPGERVPYMHKFRNRRPTLATDPHGRRLYFVGGSYRVTSRGIVG